MEAQLYAFMYTKSVILKACFSRIKKHLLELEIKELK